MLGLGHRIRELVKLKDVSFVAQRQPMVCGFLEALYPLTMDYICPSLCEFQILIALGFQKAKDKRREKKITAARFFHSVMASAGAGPTREGEKRGEKR